MNVTRIPLKAELLSELHDFVSEMWRIEGVRSEVHIGDMYFTLLFIMRGDLGSTTLWYNQESRLQAVAIFTGLTWDMVIRPEAAASQLAEGMIAWAISETERRKPRANLIRIQRRPLLAERVALLERLGFRRMSTGVLTLENTLDEPPTARPLTPGFSCRALVDGDLLSRLRAGADVFPGDARKISDYERLRRCAAYEPALDLIVVDQEQEVAAFCSTWFDRANRVGLFEPVGTRRTYRRLGLAHAVMAEAMNRVKKLGATSVVVRARNQNAAAIACYQNLGFAIVSDTFGFEKPMG